MDFSQSNGHKVRLCVISVYWPGLGVPLDQEAQNAEESAEEVHGKTEFLWTLQKLYTIKSSTPVQY